MTPLLGFLLILLHPLLMLALFWRAKFLGPGAGKGKKKEPPKCPPNTPC